jgi:uncharacterized membrane protein
VAPKYDTLYEKEGVRLNVPQDLNPSVTVLSPTEAAVTIYDGPKYNVIELPGNSGTSWMSAYALNNTSYPNLPNAAGYEYTSYGIWWWPSGGSWSFYNLPLPMYCNALAAYGINDANRIVGRATLSSGPWRGFRYESGASTTLPALSGGNAEALCISPASSPVSYIVGYSVNSSGVSRAVRWRSDNNWNCEDLKTLATPDSASYQSWANGVNSSGWVVGKALVSSSGVIHAVRLANPLGDFTAATDLGLAPSSSGLGQLNPDDPLNTSAAKFVNSNGEAVGGSHANYGTQTQWTKRYCAAYWSAATPPGKKNLGILHGGTWSEAYGINDTRQIVGGSYTSSGGAEHAFIGNSGVDSKILDLSDEGLLHGGSGWTLVRAEAINNRGYIVGQGVHNGYTRGFILIPLE